MQGLTPFQIKAKNQRAWTNPFTFLQNLSKISKNAWTNPFTFFQNCLKFKRMHELTPLHFSKFWPKIEKMHESIYIFTNFVQKLKKSMD